MPDWATLSIIASVAVFFGGAGIWLQKQFNDTRASFYRALSIHEKDDTKKFEDHGLRIQRLEIKSFGVTKIP